MSELSQDMQQYFESIEKEVAKAYDIAGKARKKGLDPNDKVELPLAKNMFERVEGLISVVAPQIRGSGIAKRIAGLEKKYSSQDWRVALIIAKEVAEEKFCKFDDKKTAMEVGIRVGFAYLTLGTVSSPLEGFVELKIKKRKDGKDYLALSYAGPVRSAGGTAAAVSVVLADYLRKHFGFDTYDPTEEETKRMSTELYDYHERVTNLQYLPSKEEIEFIVKNLPVQIDGDPSEKIEVSNYKDLSRIETNRIRSGVCLVLGEGLAQKATKVHARLSKWAEEFELDHWSFLEQFLKIQKEKKSQGKVEEKNTKIAPVYTYIQDLVAGRPVLTHPLRVGGFRLRYGRSRTSGYSAASINPATTYVLSKYIAIGTQLKVERPGKAATITTCDTIEGPTVKLHDGSVLRVETTQKAKEIADKISEILFLGDILFNYGDFFNRAHTLVPPGYCEEWWVQELEKATVDLFGTIDLDKLSGLVEIPKEALEVLLKNPLSSKLTAQAAISFSTKLNLPLYPRYTYYWKTISIDQLKTLLKWIEKAKIVKSEDKIQKMVLPLEQEAKRVLELLGVPHAIATNEFVVIEGDDVLAFIASLSLTPQTKTEDMIKIIDENPGKDTLEIVNLLSKVKLRDKGGVFIGARMGRPEKAKMRKLTGSPHVLFPVGEEGGKLRSFQSAFDSGKTTSDFPIHHCNKCKNETIFPVCEKCESKTKRMYECAVCGRIETEVCPKNNPADENNPHKTKAYKRRGIDIKHYFDMALKKTGMKSYPDLIKGVRGTSNKDHTPERLAKGILRAKHEVTVNKDGTIRYDMTQLPLTHFKASEIGTSVKKLNELGYKSDIHGKPLIDTDQILELKPQDIVLPACKSSPDLGADEIIIKTSKFLDELLVKFYGLEPYYNFKSIEDIAGTLSVALAPHTSAGILCRIIGFSQTQGFLAHPMLHATTRRDCDGDEASITLLLDALINFSRNFLPNSRGSTQDAPLVLTSRSIPSEVDDMVFDLDVAWKYPLQFYEAGMEYKMPWDVEIDQLGKRLGTEKQYEKMGFTHNTTNINAGVKCSAYKTLPSMEEKLLGQMGIAERIRAVDTEDVARLVIEKHFIRDIKGNLRKFSMQQFRCVNCNEKFRRPPLVGKCTKCGGKIIFTISEGSIIKYLEPAISMAEKYNLPPYLKHSLELTKRRVEGVFGKEKEKQTGLGSWF
jgi:DNA polymerase II large subunit